MHTCSLEAYLDSLLASPNSWCDSRTKRELPGASHALGQLASHDPKSPWAEADGGSPAASGAKELYWTKLKRVPYLLELVRMHVRKTVDAHVPQTGLLVSFNALPVGREMMQPPGVFLIAVGETILLQELFELGLTGFDMASHQWKNEEESGD